MRLRRNLHARMVKIAQSVSAPSRQCGGVVDLTCVAPERAMSCNSRAHDVARPNRGNHRSPAANPRRETHMPQYRSRVFEGAEPRGNGLRPE
jgi:hypothetical protein